MDSLLSPLTSPKDDPQHQATNALAALLDLGVNRLTYDRIEQAMRASGLDPLHAEEQYVWILDELEARQRTVVDSELSPEQELQAAEEAALDDTDEMRALLQKIVGDDITSTEPPTAEQEKNLLELIAIGKKARADLQTATSDIQIVELERQIRIADEARETLMRRNIRLVFSIALKYSTVVNHLDLDDLAQEGSIGLSRAISMFDFSLGTRLSTYATYWIRQAITRAIADQDRTIRIPVYRHEQRLRFKRAYGELAIHLTRAPSDLELAVGMGMIDETDAHILGCLLAEEDDEGPDLRQEYKSIHRQILILRRLDLQDPVSLELPVGTSDGDSRLGDFVPSFGEPDPAEIYFHRELGSVLNTVLGKLAPRTREVIERRFGLNGYSAETLEEIGNRLGGITRERVRQIEAKGLRQLKHPTRLKSLTAFWEQ